MREKLFVALAILLVISSLAIAQHGIQRAHERAAVVTFSGKVGEAANARTFTVVKSYDTNDQGNSTQTIAIDDSVKIWTFGYDKVDFIRYTWDMSEYSDNICTAYVDWFYGSNDTNRLMPSKCDTITGIDSTYDSTLIYSTVYFESDSTLFLDWIAPRVRTQFHFWKATGADSANDSYKVKITDMEVRLRND